MEELTLYIIDTDIFLDNKIFKNVYQSLDEDRQVKIDRVKAEADKRRSLGAGILFKRAMDDFGIPYSKCSLEYGEQGKPYLSLFPKICFNMSHSGSMAVLVINNCGMELGCDIEAVSEKKRLDSIARRIMTDAEFELMGEPSETNADEWKKNFYDIWTAKESYVKATGKGLGTDFRRLEIIDSEDCIQIRDTDTDDRRYIIRKRNVDGYSFSICVTKKDISIEEKRITL